MPNRPVRELTKLAHVMDKLKMYDPDLPIILRRDFKQWTVFEPLVSIFGINVVKLGCGSWERERTGKKGMEAIAIR